MTLVSLASQKGSPGTSMAALALAAALRPGEGRRKLLLEADPSGGVLAIRYRLAPDPGLVTLAAAARAGLDTDELWRHARDLPGGLPAIVCPDGPDHVHSALAAAGAAIGRHLAERRDVDVVADLGRLVPGSPVLDLAVESTALLMVARPTADQLQPAARRLAALRPEIRNLGWLLIGERPHGPAEVEDTFGFPVVGVLADDRRSVEAIAAGAITRRVRRHPYVRSAVTVAGTLRSWLSPLTDAPEVESPPADTDLGSAPDPIDLAVADDAADHVDHRVRPVGGAARLDVVPPPPVSSRPTPPSPGSSRPGSPSPASATRRSAGFRPPPASGGAAPAPPSAVAPSSGPAAPGDPSGNGAPEADQPIGPPNGHRPAATDGGPVPPAPPTVPAGQLRSAAPSPFVHEDAELDGNEP